MATLVLVLGTPSAGEAQASGQALDGSTLDAVVGARVSVQATDQRTITNDDGEFFLADASGPGTGAVRSGPRIRSDRPLPGQPCP